MKIAIIGAGNMGGATALGFVNAGKVAPADICVTAAHSETLEKFAARGIRTTLVNSEAVHGADIIIIAVKPWLVVTVLSEIKASLDYHSQIIVNLAAGLPTDFIPSILDNGDCSIPQLLNVLPNTAVEIRESMTFIQTHNASQETIALIQNLFDAVGKTMVVNEKQLAAGMALASCGIAYAMRYIHAAAQGGVELGMYPKDAVSTVCQTVIGAAKLILEHGSHPEQEIDKVTTPGGITIKGLNEMEHAGFSSAVIRGIKASKV